MQVTCNKLNDEYQCNNNNNNNNTKFIKGHNAVIGGYRGAGGTGRVVSRKQY